MYPWEIILRKELSFLEKEYKLNYSYLKYEDSEHYIYFDNTRCLIIKSEIFDWYYDLFFAKKYSDDLENVSRKIFVKSKVWQDYAELIKSFQLDFKNNEEKIKSQTIKELINEGYSEEIINWYLLPGDAEIVCYMRYFANFVRKNINYFLKLCENAVSL